MRMMGSKKMKMGSKKMKMGGMKMEMAKMRMEKMEMASMKMDTPDMAMGVNISEIESIGQISMMGMGKLVQTGERAGGINRGVRGRHN